MTRNTKAAALLTLTLLAIPALAATLADVEVGTTSVSFYSAGQRLSLVVTGPEGFAYEAELRGGDLVFEIYDADGNLLPDGTYNYELKALAGTPKAAERDNVRGLGEKTAGRRVQSGVFTIAGGSLVDPTAVEPERGIAQKLVHAEDVKIQGSLCVGADCTSGESFGFDTIRLKENNLRIKFEDTSTGSFPSNDWQLTANDSTNGGANRFSIDDVTGGKTPFTIVAGAPSSSLYVKNNGFVGMGSSNPAVQLHVVDGNSPALRLEQDGSSGFTAQTWDVAGNETNFFVRDVTHGSKLPFRIQPGSGNDNALYIASDGDLGVGFTSPDDPIHIKKSGSTAPAIRLQNGDNASDGWRMVVTDTQDLFRIVAVNSGGNTELELDSSGNMTIGGTLTQLSDRNMKTNIAAVDPLSVLAQVRELAISRWAHKDHTSVEHLGPMAQDFYATFGLGVNDRSIATVDTSGVALAAIQGLGMLLEEKEGRIKTLEARLALLEQALELVPAQ